MKLLKFYAHWCGPCKVQGSLLKGLSIPIQEIDVEEENNEDCVDAYSVMSLPTLIVVDEDGNELKRFVGLTQKEDIEKFISDGE